MKTRTFYLGAYLLLSTVSWSQTEKCEGQLPVAQDYYSGGNFNEALRLLEGYRHCLGARNSEYYLLKARICMAMDKMEEAKGNLAGYINSKSGATLTESDPQLLRDFFKQVMDSLSERQITSVSKRAEDIDLTPSTVILIKENDIVQRGYTDLVDLLGDLPGFDISKIYGINYAQVYQRGFRQENTERTLLLIDGIEENDAWSNIAYVSKQYPLSNISSVEVIYGPASTIYGPRAFVGAINIITKSHRDMVKAMNGKKSNDSLDLRLDARVFGGSYRTKGVDATLGIKIKKITVLVTARYSSTDSRDLSYVPFLDYNPDDLDKLNYSTDKLKNLTCTDTSLLAKLGITPGSKYRNYFTGYGTGTLQINPDSLSAVAAIAKKTDKENYIQKINGSTIGFANNSYHYYVGAKIKTEHFEIGARTWKCHEGFNLYQDIFAASAKNGSSWEPMNTTLYSVYKRSGKSLIFTNTSSYGIYSLGKNSLRTWYNGYYNLFSDPSYSNLNIFNILFPDSEINGYKQGWANKYFFYRATQFRNDARLNYSKNRLDVFGGIEVRSSQLQGDFITYENVAGPILPDQSSAALAETQGTVSGQSKGSNSYGVFDLGIYSQAVYKLKDSVLYLTCGGRFDYNRIRSNDGFGGRFNPKLALVYVKRSLLFKLIYASGLQNASNWTKYSTGGGRTANGTLKPEAIRNVEFIVQNKQRTTDYNWDVCAFFSDITNAISGGVDPNDGKKKNMNNGRYNIFGVQINFGYVPFKKPFSVYSNLTYNSATQTENASTEYFINKAIGDIAPVKFNAIANYHLRAKKQDLNFNLRANYVGTRPVGPNTTVTQNSGINNTNSIPRFLVFFGTIGYKPGFFNPLLIQLSINNILDRNILGNAVDYYNPGARTASGNYTTAYQGEQPWVPQNRRNFQLTIRYAL